MSTRWRLRATTKGVVLSRRKNGDEWLIGTTETSEVPRVAIAERLESGDELLDVDGQSYFVLTENFKSRKN